MKVFITGHSRGLGAALCRHYLESGSQVFGLSRSMLDDAHPGLAQVACDLAERDAIAPALDALLAQAGTLDLAYLNAGVLGRIANLHETSLADIETVMDINVWANKVMLDWLARQSPPARQIILMSSGAAVVGMHGWGAYALSKATLNMLAMLYAQEMPASHLVALAPGLVDTDMQALLREVDGAAFPSVLRLRHAQGTADMPTPAVAAARIAALAGDLMRYPSGSYVDIRKL